MGKFGRAREQQLLSRKKLFGQKRASKHQDRGRKGIGVKAYWWAKFFTQHVATEAILTVSLT